jgi:hypothetical protein
MDECPKCHSWTISYDFQWERKKCYSIICNYSEWYCPHKWLIENDCLDTLLGKPHIIEGKCRDYSEYMKPGFNLACLDCICLPEDKRVEFRIKIVSEVL